MTRCAIGKKKEKKKIEKKNVKKKKFTIVYFLIKTTEKQTFLKQQCSHQVFVHRLIDQIKDLVAIHQLILVLPKKQKNKKKKVVEKQQKNNSFVLFKRNFNSNYIM